MKPEFSVILNRYDTNRVQLHTTMACLAAIRKFTDMPYEIIVVDNEPLYDIRDDYHVLEPYIKVVYTPKLYVFQAYNAGADLAKSDKLIFIQNDVFVHERTLNKLAVYLDKFDYAFPQQVPISREDALKISNTPDGKETHIGALDEGMVGFKRRAFEKVGGWDERYHNMLGGRAMWERCNEGGLSRTDHTNCFITHIMAASNLAKDPKLYNEEMAHDSNIS